MRKIERIEPTVPQIRRKKRVAAYARVSMETDRLNHSLSAQVSYYSDLIQKNPEWEYAGVYADSFISGTSTKNRAEFQRMIADCEDGRIDIVLTKSISRFARNTVDLLETVRHLKSIGVEVRFEKENINSLKADGEVMLSILASFAQEESVSISNNVKWGTRKRFDYQKRYDEMVSRYDDAKEKYDKTIQAIQSKHAQAERLDAFVKTLASRDEALAEFDEGVWGTLVEHMTVYGKGDIGVTFKDGTEIRI